MAAGRGAGEDQNVLCPRHADVTQPPLFFERLRIEQRAAVRQQPLLHAAEEHHGKFQPLGAMQRHQCDARAAVVGVHIADQRGVVQKLLQILAAIAAVGGGVGEFLNILHAAEGLRCPVALQHVDIFGALDHQTQQVRHAGRRHQSVQLLHQRAKLLHCRSGARRQQVFLKRLAHSLPERHAVFERQRFNLAHRGVADAARGRVDDADQADGILEIGSGFEICQQVLHFGALVKADGADNVVGKPVAAQRLFIKARLRVRAVEHSKPRVGLAAMALRNPVGDKQAFVLGVQPLIHSNLCATLTRCPQLLTLAVAVVRNNRAGGVENALRGAVVFLQAQDLRLRVIVLKLHNVADVGSPPGVDRLVLVANGT